MPTPTQPTGLQTERVTMLLPQDATAHGVLREPSYGERWLGPQPARTRIADTTPSRGLPGSRSIHQRITLARWRMTGLALAGRPDRGGVPGGCLLARRAGHSRVSGAGGAVNSKWAAIVLRGRTGRFTRALTLVAGTPNVAYTGERLLSWVGCGVRWWGRNLHSNRDHT
jgi:hypothetical protein